MTYSGLQIIKGESCVGKYALEQEKNLFEPNFESFFITLSLFRDPAQEETR
jgi:hypothetical protein